MERRVSHHDFRYESKFATIDGMRIHYVEEGAGRPVLFVHGNPTWSYLWRNIIPKVAETERALAIDLLGFGKSDKPVDADYSFDQHCAIVSEFIQSMGLKDVALVLHDWGGLIGMNYAIDHVKNVRRVVLLSTFVAPVALPFASVLRLIRDSALTPLFVQRLNLFMPLVLRLGVARRSSMSDVVREQYYAPFPDYASRRSVRRWPEQIPLVPSDITYQALDRIGRALPSFDRQVLVLKADRDPILTMKRAEWLVQTLPRGRLVVIEQAGHFAQEDQPSKVATAISAFLREEGQGDST